MLGAKQSGTMVVVALLSASAALCAWPDRAGAHDVGPERMAAIAVGELSLWLEDRFSAAELEQLRPEDLEIESHFCSCSDRPEPHFPYPLVVLSTPKGDLIARPESREGALSFTRLAVRHGNRYCDLESEQSCYGSFNHPCDFTDHRFGPTLAEFFPTCKSKDGTDVTARR